MAILTLKASDNFMFYLFLHPNLFLQMRYLLQIAFIILFVFSANSQNELLIDSLELRMEFEQNPSEKIKLLKSLSLKLKYQDIEKSINYAREALQIATKIDDKPSIIGIDDFVDEPKPAVRLFQNYPNPFSRETTIEFILNEPSHLTLEIFNLQGQKVKTLLSGNLPAGNHQIKWDGTNALGNKSAKGIYTYRLSADGFTRTYKMFYTR